MKRRNMKKMIALLMAAATMTVGTANTIAPVSVMAETAANVEIFPAELSEILPETNDEARAFENEYGAVSIHGKYLVVISWKAAVPVEYQFDQFGSSELICVMDVKCPSEETLHPGSRSYYLQVYKCDKAGYVRADHYYQALYEDVKSEQVTKFLKADDDLNISEITKEDFARGFLWQEKTFDLDVSGNTMIFENNDPDSELSVIVSSNLKHKVTTDGKKASFTPSEDGRYVVSVENMVTWQMRDDNLNGYDYKFPLLSNYVVDVKDGVMTYSYKGIHNYYDGSQIKELEDKYFSDENVKDTTPYNVEMFSSYEYYFRGGGPYYAFAGSYLKGYIDGTNIERSFITNIFRPDKTESYFNVHSRVNKETDWHIENNRCIEHMGRFSTSSSCEGDLKNPSPDMLTNYVFMACGGSGQGSVTVDGVTFELNIVDDMFVPKSGADSGIESIIPKTNAEFEAFVKENGMTSIHGDYLIFCDNVNYSTGENLRLDQWGSGELELVGSYSMPEEEPIIDGRSTPTVNVYKGVKSGVLKAEWVHYNEWNGHGYDVCTEYYAIDGGMGIVPIDRDKYELNYMYDPDIPQDVQGVLPVNIEMYSAFVKKYGSAVQQGQYVIFCDDVNLNKGEKLNLTQTGDGGFEAVMAYDVDDENGENGDTTHIVVVYKASSAGKVMTSWEVTSPETGEKKEILVKYYGIDDKLNVTEITEDDFYPIVRGDANGDGVFTIADMAVLGKWLLGRSAEMPSPKNVDVCKDGKIDVFDFAVLRQEVAMKVAENNNSADSTHTDEWVSMGTIS